MIFVTLGSQKFQFNRLLIKVDELVENGTISEKVFAQTGYSDYVPKNYTYKIFLDREEFASMEAEADVVITHGGTGAIIGAVKNGKKVIAVPRLAQYGEHVDDHQIQIVEQFSDMGFSIPCFDVSELEGALEKAEHFSPKTYVSNTARIIESIEAFLKKEE